MTTRNNIYARAQRNARATGVDFRTFAMDLYNDVMDQVALMAKRRGQWTVAVVDGTSSYDYSDAAVAVPDTPTATQPLFNGIEFIKLLKDGETEYEDLYIRDRANWVQDHVRILGTVITFNTEPDFDGDMELYGFVQLAHWTTNSDEENAIEPDIPDEFHAMISDYITAGYELSYRRDRGMYEFWNDKYQAKLRDFNRIMDGDATSQGFILQDVKW